MIDDFSKYDFFYVNGCSFTEGGGLEEPNIRNNSVLPLYEKYYNVTWKNRKEVNWGYRLSQILNIPCYNDAACGGSMERLVRTTYDFINKNWEKRDKFFIILEYIEPSRSEVFYTKDNLYYIINSNWSGKSDIYDFYAASTMYYSKELNNDYEKTQKYFKQWFDNHYSFKENMYKNDKLIVGLYSFCKLNNIKIYMMKNVLSEYSKYINNDDIINLSKKEDSGYILNYCVKRNLTIEQELIKYDSNVKDSHPGFFGHIHYAVDIATYLGWKDEIHFKEIEKYKEKITLI